MLSKEIKEINLVVRLKYGSQNVSHSLKSCIHTEKITTKAQNFPFKVRTTVTFYV